MNAFTFDELYVGLSVCFDVEITQEKLDHFIRISGDNSVLHTEESFAIAKGFKGVPVHGMLTSAFYSQLVGMHLPGKNGYSQEYKLSFTSPVYVNDSLTVRGEIEYINEVLRQVWIVSSITNQDGILVSRAKIKAGIF